MKVGTHDGIFHIDEIAAIAMLKNEWDVVKVIRSRNTNVLEECDILVDVGGKYDGVKYFDHHHFKEDNALYGKSSAGLVADAIGHKGFEDFIAAIDARDTRVGYQRYMDGDEIFNLVNDCNLLDIGSPEQDVRFMELVEIFAKFFSCELNCDGLYTALDKIAEETKSQKDAILEKRHEEK